MSVQQEVYVQESLTIQSNCIACLQSDDSRCPDCQEEVDNKQTILAHEMVEEGSLQYAKPLTWLVDMPSGHDWVGAVTITRDGRERHEFVEPTVSMEDRTFSPLLEVGKHEIVCSNCHLVCWDQIPCPNCEAVN